MDFIYRSLVLIVFLFIIVSLSISLAMVTQVSLKDNEPHKDGSIYHLKISERNSFTLLSFDFPESQVGGDVSELIFRDDSFYPENKLVVVPRVVELESGNLKRKARVDYFYGNPSFILPSISWGTGINRLIVTERESKYIQDGSVFIDGQVNQTEIVESDLLFTSDVLNKYLSTPLFGVCLDEVGSFENDYIYSFLIKSQSDPVNIIKIRTRSILKDYFPTRSFDISVVGINDYQYGFTRSIARLSFSIFLAIMIISMVFVYLENFSKINENVVSYATKIAVGGRVYNIFLEDIKSYYYKYFYPLCFLFIALAVTLIKTDIFIKYSGQSIILFCTYFSSIIVIVLSVLFLFYYHILRRVIGRVGISRILNGSSKGSGKFNLGIISHLSIFLQSLIFIITVYIFIQFSKSVVANLDGYNRFSLTDYMMQLEFSSDISPGARSKIINDSISEIVNQNGYDIGLITAHPFRLNGNLYGYKGPADFDTSDSDSSSLSYLISIIGADRQGLINAGVSNARHFEGFQNNDNTTMISTELSNTVFGHSKPYGRNLPSGNNLDYFNAPEVIDVVDLQSNSKNAIFNTLFGSLPLAFIPLDQQSLKLQHFDNIYITFTSERDITPQGALVMKSEFYSIGPIKQTLISVYNEISNQLIPLIISSLVSLMTTIACIFSYSSVLAARFYALRSDVGIRLALGGLPIQILYSIVGPIFITVGLSFISFYGLAFLFDLIFSTILSIELLNHSSFLLALSGATLLTVFVSLPVFFKIYKKPTAYYLRDQ